jgi:two-component system, OmpR family, sensor histidine kinase QseC
MSTGGASASAMAADPDQPQRRTPVPPDSGRVTSPTLSELLRVMAHDLRNPLSALVTNLHYLTGVTKGMDADAREALGDSVSLCDVLERLITNLDVLARGDERGRQRFPTSLLQVAQTVVKRQRPQAASSGIELLLEEDGQDMLVMVERELFALAAENIVANAIEHAPSGSKVRVRTGMHEGQAALMVFDDAPPVPADLREQAVSLHGQGRHGRAPETRYGRGLGMLCADLAARGAGGRLLLDADADASVMRLLAPVG